MTWLELGIMSAGRNKLLNLSLYKIGFVGRWSSTQDFSGTESSLVVAIPQWFSAPCAVLT